MAAGQYAQAEALLKQALGAGLASPRDRAAAHKQLAFIYCTSQRVPACEADAVRIEPAVSSVAIARARMRWPSEQVEVVSAVGRDAHAVLRQPMGSPLDVDAVPLLVHVAIAEVALQCAGRHPLGLLEGR